MAGAITISSPSLSPVSAMASSMPANHVKKAIRPPAPTNKDIHQPSDAPAPSTKRKQSKSRNGCVTCKAKRLKCDETKPTCQQCARRTVPCGGYKKDFKWRPFEETTYTAPGKASAKTKKKGVSTTSYQPLSQFQIQVQPQIQHHPQPVRVEPTLPQNAYYSSVRPPQGTNAQTRAFSNTLQPPQAMSNVYTCTIPPPSPYVPAPSPTSPVESFVTGSAGSGSSVFESGSVDTQRTRVTASSSASPGQSPRLVDLLLPGTDLNMPPEEYSSFLEQHESFYQPTGLTPPSNSGDDDDIEELPRHPESEWRFSSFRAASPTPSDSSSSARSNSPKTPIYMVPQPTSTDMLTRRFDRDTCGILSVKDGPTENPWRMLIWPLARDCEALYHAIVSMTSFHQSRDAPALRIHGIDHMRTSIHALRAGLENMRVDAAISTTLVLAFSESWDQHISTGINHIKGAKMLIDKALVQHNKKPMRGEELARLQFLCNTWTYMDVIARLTSTDGDESHDYDSLFDSFNMGGSKDAQLDPLMGCAGTLFPVIGRVANLVRKVRQTHTDHNSPAIISQAIELKRQLEQWMPPSYIEDPEDETTSPHDSIKTATAYQYATLLYLHQAIPEAPSLPSLTLAQKICREIATVPMSSRSTIVQIFPLMAAGCELVSECDRQWVRDRWDMMARRMKIGIIEKCLDVTREVWTRRDAFSSDTPIFKIEESEDGFSPALPLKRSFDTMAEDSETAGGFSWLEPSRKRQASVTNLLPEFTVKGRLHWLGVMTDWNWEGECLQLYFVTLRTPTLTCSSFTWMNIAFFFVVFAVLSARRL
ncbi:hypothetical protein DM02DRAFT_515697 [Periconia macrospinosa]|uniref:Zn(2)-C6 fungal-type domain-containing protein n=1 Tax=Periconia macrospinosa TaxID=97972 RepID=A0A2V1E7C1_9PLEO|nr:hypothetical protein DM02DRAFT_515697 [Periconia macrospinosa]